MEPILYLAGWQPGGGEAFHDGCIGLTYGRRGAPGAGFVMRRLSLLMSAHGLHISPQAN